MFAARRERREREEREAAEREAEIRKTLEELQELVQVGEGYLGEFEDITRRLKGAIGG